MAQRPNLYIMPTYSINAFAVGIREKNRAIVVTAGLLAKLNRDEIQGVIAHEISHIINRDILLLTFAATLLVAFRYSSRRIGVKAEES